MKKILSLTLFIYALWLQPLSAQCPASCQLPTWWSGGQLTDYNNINTKPDSLGLYTNFSSSAYWAWVTWQDYNNAYLCNWSNPGITGYDVEVFNADGSKYLQVKNTKFHSTWLYPYFALPTDVQRSGDFYVCFPIEPGRYTYRLTVNCASGSKLDTGFTPFDVVAAAPPVPIVSPTQKKRSK